MRMVPVPLAAALPLVSLHVDAPHLQGVRMSAGRRCDMARTYRQVLVLQEGDTPWRQRRDLERIEGPWEGTPDDVVSQIQSAAGVHMGWTGEYWDIDDGSLWVGVEKEEDDEDIPPWEPAEHRSRKHQGSR